MSITDHKITSFTNPIINEADRPLRSAYEMKRIFDSNSDELKNAFNALIDALVASTGADEIGASVNGMTGNSVKELLSEFKTRFDELAEYVEHGFTGPPGPTGDSGVYVGEEEPTDENIDVWINPNGNAAAITGNVGILKSDGTEVSAAIPGTDYAAANHSHSSYAAKSSSVAKTLSADGWVNNQQTVSVTGVTASNNVLITPATVEDGLAWAAAGLTIVQASGVITFSCDTVPTVAIAVNILILG